MTFNLQPSFSVFSRYNALIRTQRRGSAAYFREDRLTRRLFGRLVLVPVVLLSLMALTACDSKPQSAEQPASAAPTPAQTQNPAPASTPAAPQAATTLTETPASSKSQEKPGISTPSIPVPPPSASMIAGLPDVDPHKTRGSKTAPIVMETFSDFQCPA